MPASEDVLRRVIGALDDGSVAHVRIVMVDLHGVPRAKLVTAEHFRRVISRGHPYALPLLAADLWQTIPPQERNLTEDIGWGNGLLVPDLTSFTPLPWTRDTALVMADAFDRDGVPQPSSRQVLAAALRRARSAGFEPVFGSELEFYLFRPEQGDQGFDGVFTRQSWFSSNALAMVQDFIDALTDVTRGMGLPLYEIMAEHGAGQLELNLSPGSGLRAVDDVISLKLAIKEVAQRVGMRATFLAKPTNLWETPASGYHLHQMLADAAGGNAFYDSAAEDDISEVCRHYIGGQLAHALAMTGVACPTVTAYKRFLLGTVAPLRVAWGIDNRSAVVRVVPGGDNTHIENRLGSSDANPYLLAAVCVQAGMLGVEHGLDPGPPGTGNMFVDERYTPLPATLIEGIDRYEADEDLAAALGADFTRIFTNVIRQDWRRYMEHVSDWEIREYREML
ncbi:MAG: glutamine synthetase family protein [Acidimicrobiales bacterium]